VIGADAWSIEAVGRELPAGLRIYAIGDLHGRADLLDALHEPIAEDRARRPAQAVLIVYIGDYIDRGPDSAGVVERLADPPHDGAERVHLIGNHEDVMRAALRADPAAMSNWLHFGGVATLASYGIEPRRLAGMTAAQIAEAALEAMPARHRAFFDRLSISHTVGGYFFCHAGVRPGVPLALQDHFDLVWIREPFLFSEADFGKIIVHGHTPAEVPELMPNRINIDTGAVYGGRLTAVVLEDRAIRFLAVGP